MATYYVGPGGNDGNSGLTWALRKLTLNGAEDVPVVANDTVYVGPGVYREVLTLDVSGNAGNPITYIGDVSGENTDDVGGIVRITGSDNDQTSARNNCITSAGNQRDYRTFQGFMLDTVSQILVNNSGDGTNWIIRDCILESEGGNLIQFNGSGTNHLVQRCVFLLCESGQYDIRFVDGETQDDTGSIVENCIFISGSSGVYIQRIGGITVRNCNFLGRLTGAVEVAIALAGGQTTTVNNCIFAANAQAVVATAIGEITENYNTFYGNGTDRTNTNVGAQSQTYPPLYLPPILLDGIKYPWWFCDLSEWSAVRAITGTGTPSDDLFGKTRPVTASKLSWGSNQFVDAERETGTTRTGGVSIVFHDAGRHQIWVPVTATSTTISIYVRREANYAGNLPQMIIKQPGQADDITTDVGLVNAWNLLTTTLVPAADPPYVVIELVSRNTAVALAYEVFFDDLDVS